MQVVGQTHFFNELQLGFQKIDVLFGIVQNAPQQIARHVVTGRFGHSNAIFDGGLGPLFTLQVTGQHFGHGLAHQQLGHVLQVGQAVQHEDAVHQFVGMFHLADGLFVFLFGQFFKAPMLEHAEMQEILVNGGQLVFKLGLQLRDDFFIALHGGLLVYKG